MKRLIVIFFVFLYSIVSAQNNTGIPIPMKNGIVFYEKAFPVNKSEPIDKQYFSAEKWLKTSFPDSKEKITVDKTAGTFSFKAVFKIITDAATGHYYWIKPAITIIARRDSCILQLYNYYEKPIMSGVTNDYSKIEYRWWDFRKGKPWNKEDAELFKGLNQQTLSIIDSFEKSINSL
jgi:hypothetical protein